MRLTRRVLHLKLCTRRMFEKGWCRANWTKKLKRSEKNLLLQTNKVKVIAKKYAIQKQTQILSELKVGRYWLI